MRLTSEQRAALDALTPKRRAFVLALARTGDATTAATEAGYAVPMVEGCRLVKRPEVIAALATMRTAVEAAGVAAIASATEAQAFWSAVMRGELRETKVDAEGFELEQPVAMRDRLKASELLGKAKGLFAADQSPQVQVGVQLVVTRDTAIQVIEATREGEGR